MGPKVDFRDDRHFALRWRGLSSGTKTVRMGVTSPTFERTRDSLLESLSSTSEVAP